MNRRELTVWVQILPAPRWPYMAVGKVYKRKPRVNPGPLVKVVLDLPSDLFDPVATVKAVLESRPPVEGVGTWEQ